MSRLCLPGHGRPFGDVAARIAANREEIHAKLDEVEQYLAAGEATAFELVARAFPEFDASMMGWALTIMLCFLTHLERTGRAERVRPDGQEPERWRLGAPTAARP